MILYGFAWLSPTVCHDRSLYEKTVGEKVWAKGCKTDFHREIPPMDIGIFYYFTKCPLNDYARAYGYMEILPVMCELDFQLAGLCHARLYREQTLAGGGTMYTMESRA